MPGIVTDSDVYQSPLSAAVPEYGKIGPSWEQKFGAMFGDSSTVGALGRAAERGYSAPDASYFDKAIASYGEGEPGAPEFTKPAPEPLLDPEEINSRFAPTGPDGKSAKIATAPMSATLGAIIGRQKQDELNRNAILARASQSDSGLGNFATGMLAFTMDPLNAATMFIPGIGEEAIAARLGGGFAARIGGRLVSGATAGALSQVPVTALKYGLGQEEASDYGLRDAFRDVLYASVGNAVLHTGFGTAAELWRGGPRVTPQAPVVEGESARAPPPAETIREAGSILTADADTKYEGMRAAIAQLTEGRPLDAMPVINMKELALLSEEAQLREKSAQVDEFLTGLEVQPEAQASAEQVARVRAVEDQLKAENITPEQRRTLSNRRDELLTDTSPETLQETAAPLEMKRQAEAQKAALEARLDEIAHLRTKSNAEAALSTLPRVANGQSELYRNGFAPSVSDAEMKATTEAIYGPKEKAPEAPKAATEPAATTPKATEGATAPREPVEKPKSETAVAPEAVLAPAHMNGAERDLAETDLKGLSVEERADLEATAAEITSADARAQTMQEAAVCLAGGLA